MKILTVDDLGKASVETSACFRFFGSKEDVEKLLDMFATICKYEKGKTPGQVVEHFIRNQIQISKYWKEGKNEQ